MRSYAQLSPTFWTHGAGRKLRGNTEAIALVVYLMSAPSSNLIGLYYVPLVSICHELGLTAAQVHSALAIPAVAEVVQYDSEAEVAWLPDRAREELGDSLKPKDKRLGAVQRELAAFAYHRFAAAFRARYGVAYGLDHEPLPAAADAPPKGLPLVGKPPCPVPAPVLDPVPVQPEQPEPVATPRARPSRQSDRDPRNLAQALELDVHERAKLVEQRTDLVHWLQPHAWPEVRDVFAAFAAATGSLAAIQQYERDSGVRAVVSLFAAETPQGGPALTADQIRDAAERAPREAWWSKDGAKRGLSALSVEVVRRTLATNLSPEEQARVDRALGGLPNVRRSRGAAGPTSLGAALGRFGGTG